MATDKYYPGLGCQCMARHQGDCACSVDWTPSEVYELRGQFEELRIAVLNTIPFIPGGEAKAKLLDAYDKATEQLEE